MGKSLFGSLFRKIVCVLSVMVLSFTFSALTVNTADVQAAENEESGRAGSEEHKRGTSEKGQKMRERMKTAAQNASFTQIMKSITKATPDGNVGTFERSVTGENVSVRKRTIADGTILISLDYSKEDVLTGEMHIFCIPSEDGYYFDLIYYLYRDGELALTEYLRTTMDAELNYDISASTDKEWCKTAYLEKDKEITLYDPINDILCEYTLEVEKNGLTEKEYVTCYQYFDGEKELKYTSESFITEYILSENQELYKYYCNVYNSKGSITSTYISVEDIYNEQGINKINRIFAWDGAHGRGKADGKYEIFGCQLSDETGETLVTASTCNANYYVIEEDDYKEILEGVYDMTNSDNGSKYFGYEFSGEGGVKIRGLFAKYRGAYTGELGKKDLTVVDVAKKGTTHRSAYAVNYLEITPNADGTIEVDYNQYDEVDRDSTTMHFITSVSDGEGKNTITGDETMKVNFTIPQTIEVKKSRSIKASKLADGDVNLKLDAKAFGKITCTKVSGDENVKISKNGKITVKQGEYEPGTVLKLKIKLTAAKARFSKKTTKTVTLKIKIK